MAIRRRIVQPPGQSGQFGHEAHPDADRATVPPPVLLAPLHGMAQGVPVVEDLAEPGFLQILADYVRLDLDAAADEVDDDLAARV